MEIVGTIAKIRSKLNLDAAIWTEVYTQEDTDGVHYVLGRNYDPRIARSLKPSHSEHTQCWVGFHCHEPLGRKSVSLTVDTVYVDPNTGKNHSGVEAFKRKLRRPMDIDLSGDYVLDLDLGIIKNRPGIDVSKQFLSKAYEAHTKSAFLWKGLLFRVKYRYVRTFLAKVYSGLSVISRVLLRVTSGERYQRKYQVADMNITEDIYYQKLMQKDVNIVKIAGDTPIKFMDIEVNAYSAASYSALHLILALVYVLANLDVEYVQKIVGNVFLSVAYVVFTLYLWEKAIPRLLRNSVLFFAKKSVDSSNASVKV